MEYTVLIVLMFTATINPQAAVIKVLKTKFLVPETPIPKPMLEIEMQALKNLQRAIQTPKSQPSKSIITTPTPKNLSPATPHPTEIHPTSHPYLYQQLKYKSSHCFHKNNNI